MRREAAIGTSATSARSRAQADPRPSGRSPAAPQRSVHDARARDRRPADLGQGRASRSGSASSRPSRRRAGRRRRARLDPAASPPPRLPIRCASAACRGARSTICAISRRTSNPGALDPEAWRELDDDALIAALVEVKGIGRWTAEMFLIFHELRADVLPVDDIGLQRAIAAALPRRRAARRRRPCAISRTRGGPTAASRRGICGARSTRFRSNTDAAVADATTCRCASLCGAHARPRARRAGQRRASPATAACRRSAATRIAST